MIKIVYNVDRSSLNLVRNSIWNLHSAKITSMDCRITNVSHHCVYYLPRKRIQNDGNARSKIWRRTTRRDVRRISGIPITLTWSSILGIVSSSKGILYYDIYTLFFNLSHVMTLRVDFRRKIFKQHVESSRLIATRSDRTKVSSPELCIQK